MPTLFAQKRKVPCKHPGCGYIARGDTLMQALAELRKHGDKKHTVKETPPKKGVT